MKTLFLALMLIAQNSKAQELLKVTLDDAIEYAIQNNFGLKAYQKEAESFDAQASASVSTILPRVGIVGGTEVKRDAQTQQNATIGYLYGQYNLFNGFRDVNEIKKSSALKNISEIKQSREKNRIRADVKKYFYEFIFQKKTLSFLEESLSLNTHHLGTVKRRKASGLVSDSDLMDFELRDSFLKSEIASVKVSMQEAQLNLIRLMGPEITSHFEPQGELSHFHLDGTVEEYLAEAKDRNEDIKESLSDLDHSRAVMNQANAGWLPRVDFEVRYGNLGIDERLEGTNSPQMDGSVLMKWELFSGNETRSNQRAALASVSKAEFQFRQILLNSLTTVEMSIRKLKSIEQRVDLEELNQDRAERLYRSVFREYERGVKNSADVKTAEQTLLEAKLRRMQFKKEFIENKILLESIYNIKLRLSTVSDRHTVESKKATK